MKKSDFINKLQEKIDSYKSCKTTNHTESLWSFMANMCKIEDWHTNGLVLRITPYGFSNRFSLEHPYIPDARRGFDLIFKRAIIEAIENILFMYEIHLKELKEDINPPPISEM